MTISQLTHLTKFVLIFLLTLSLTITWIPGVTAQISLFPTDKPTSNNESNWWDPNKAYQCGKLLCSDVLLYGSGFPNFTIAIEPKIDEPETVAIFEVEQRAKLIQKTFKSISRRTFNLDQRKQLQEVEKSILSKLNWQYWFLTRDKRLHPQTPKIEVGIENNLTVIYVPKQPELGLSSQTIATVTEADYLVNGNSIKDVAQNWKKIIRERLSKNLWGHHFNKIYPLGRLIIVGAIAFLAASLIILITVGRRVLRSKNRQLKIKLREIQESLAINPELGANDEITEVRVNEDEFNLKKEPSINEQISQLETTSETLKNEENQSYLQQQTLLKQRRNIMQFSLRFLFWLQILIILLAVALIMLVYPFTRFFSYFFLGQGLVLPLIWTVTSLIDKISDLLIDNYLNQWAEEAQLNNPSSNRYTLRVNTYSSTLKGATTLIFSSIGVYLTIRVFGINPAILASAGVVAVVVAFLSRNLLEDMLNGALILATDRYAIGDVIIVGSVSGFVEDMNIYTTQLRGAEGRLITIPNGKISIVENLTKDWSRVDFKIVIAHNADAKKALTIIEQVAEQMRSEAEWEDKILEPAIILGVDDVSHAGIMIQVWIKTNRMEHWSVGREYRLRIKQEFDLAGIKLGVPQRHILYENN